MTFYELKQKIEKFFGQKLKPENTKRTGIINLTFESKSGLRIAQIETYEKDGSWKIGGVWHNFPEYWNELTELNKVENEW